MSGGRQGTKAFRKLHTDGSPWANGQTVDGKPSGYWEWFRTDGTRMRSGYFEAGRQVGEWTTYDRRGKVYMVTKMKPGAAGRSAARTSSTAERPDPRWKSQNARTPAQYIAGLPPDRAPVIKRLRRILRDNLPGGFAETIDYGMICYVVPHSLYPAGYHVDPARGLPFIALASQKQYVALYHMGLYAGPLLAWFREEWPKRTAAKLDLGKSCLRLRRPDDIPYDLVADLARRMTPKQWIAAYEAARGKNPAKGRKA